MAINFYFDMLILYMKGLPIYYFIYRYIKLFFMKRCVGCGAEFDMVFIGIEKSKLNWR